MKKLFALTLMTVLLLSMLPAVFAENEDNTIELEDAIVEEVQSMTIDQCVARFQESYPEARPAELREKCALAKKIVQNTDIRPVTAAKIADKTVDAKTSMIQQRNEVMQKIRAEYEEKFAQLTEEQKEKIAKLDRARVNEYLEQSPDEIKKSLDNVRVTQVKKEDAFKKREVAQERMEQAKEKYQKAVKNYEQAKNQFAEKKQAWSDAVASGDETAAINYAKEYLAHGADMVIESLEKVKANTEGNDDLTEEEATNIIEDINNKIAEMELLQEQLNLAETKDEVKAVGKEIVRAWEGMRNRVQMHTEKVVKTQVGEILSRSEALEQRLEKTLEHMGENVSVELDEQITTFSELVANAREKFAESETLFEDAKENDNRESFETSKALAREAHDSLKEANKVLTQIVRDIKQAGYDIEDQEYVEIIEEIDEKAEEEIEVEVEIEEGIAHIEVEFNNTKMEFTMETTNIDEIVNKIVSETGLTEEEVRANLKLEEEETEEESETEEKTEDELEDEDEEEVEEEEEESEDDSEDETTETGTNESVEA